MTRKIALRTPGSTPSAPAHSGMTKLPVACTMARNPINRQANPACVMTM
jgi:hypothetical protein